MTDRDTYNGDGHEWVEYKIRVAKEPGTDPATEAVTEFANDLEESEAILFVEAAKQEPIKHVRREG